ncbi:MAG: IS1595 family transposase [Candidatus Micrarchaeaceae archaeon]
MSEPKTLQEAILYFADADNCLNYLIARRWPNGVVCPTCGRKDVSFVPNRRVWQCKTRHPKAQFSIKVGTIFEDSPIALDKWLLTMWMLANCKNGVSSYEISRATGITQKSTWFMLQRIRLALQDETGGKLGGEVEADETYIGGLARNMHKDRREKRIPGTGSIGKIAVMGLLERHGEVRAKVVMNIKQRTLQGYVREHVEPGSQLFTDALPSYDGLAAHFVHNVIDHAEEYVRGNIHTNGLENFWSLLKRGIKGTYGSIEPFHLFRYVDEQAFRFNNRKDMHDGERFDLAVRQIVGKRLTWAQVTGKVGEKPATS